MNIRFMVGYSLVSIVIGYTVFFAVSGIPAVDYFMFAFSGLLVQFGIVMTIRYEPASVIMRGLVNLTMIIAAYTLWGWPLLWGSLAMGGVGLCMAAVYGLLYWATERYAQF